jgi:hypothetical protein
MEKSMKDKIYLVGGMGFFNSLPPFLFTLGEWDIGIWWA